MRRISGDLVAALKRLRLGGLLPTLAERLTLAEKDQTRLFVERNARVSTVVTSNRHTAEWIAAFDDALLAQSAVRTILEGVHTSEGDQRPGVEDEELRGGWQRRPRRQRPRFLKAMLWTASAPIHSPSFTRRTAPEYNGLKMPRVTGIRVVRSPIHGYGVVALRDFADGEAIAEVDGVAWREGENVDDRYSLRIEDGVYFDMVDQTRFINHSCDPNTWVEVGVTDDGQAWATVIALRPIAAGEELSYDYAFPANLAEPCRCGAPKCRGLIIDEDHLVPVAGGSGSR